MIRSGTSAQETFWSFQEYADYVHPGLNKSGIFLGNYNVEHFLGVYKAFVERKQTELAKYKMKHMCSND